MKKYLVIFTVMITLFFSGCTNRKDDPTIRIAEQFGLAYAPLQIMKEKKILERINPKAKVQWLKLGNTAAIREAVLSGDLDIGFMGIPPFLIARDKGMPWKIATGLSSAPLGLVVPSGKYTSLRDFGEHAKIALPQPGSIQHILLAMACEREEGNPALLDRHLLSLKHPDGMNALLSGAVEGHFTSPPYLFLESDLDDFEILISGEKAMGEPFTFIVGGVTEEFYGDNPVLYNDFLKAVRQSINFISENKNETLDILSEVYSMEKDKLHDLLYRPEMDFGTSVKGLEPFISFMHRNGYLDQELSQESVLF